MKVNQGQLVGIVGPVGAGKSSLLAALLGWFDFDDFRRICMDLDEFRWIQMSSDGFVWVQMSSDIFRFRFEWKRWIEMDSDRLRWNQID